MYGNVCVRGAFPKWSARSFGLATLVLNVYVYMNVSRYFCRFYDFSASCSIKLI